MPACQEGCTSPPPHHTRRQMTVPKRSIAGLPQVQAGMVSNGVFPSFLVELERGPRRLLFVHGTLLSNQLRITDNL